MTTRPIKLCIAALGGQGGAVLAEWLTAIAEAEGYLAQSTSVPGVAQRTGATIYYLEFFPKAAAESAAREPVLALMPVSGDVDCVIASELVEAGRAIQRGLVTSDKTTLLASSHRSYTISEKSALGQGATDEVALTELMRTQSKRLVLFDMHAIAEKHKSVISSVLLGALCGARVLPFPREAFENVIKSSGIAVATNLTAFADACFRAEHAVGGTTIASSSELAAAGVSEALPRRARTAGLQPLLDRLHQLPAAVQSLALQGVRRSLDYQDRAYAELYLTRLERIVALDGSIGVGVGSERSAAGRELSKAVARSLALWMTFEDTIRVADLKTRSARFQRVRAEILADEHQLFGITEFMKPRVPEIAGTLPASLGQWVLSSPRISRSLGRWTAGKQIRTSTLSGFLLLYTLGGLKRWRRKTLRYHEENTRIEQWLDRIEQVATTHYFLAVELARSQRLIKGYGETYERGWKNFLTLLAHVEALSARDDGDVLLARLHEAALADEDGTALSKELGALHERSDPSRQTAQRARL